MTKTKYRLLGLCVGLILGFVALVGVLNLLKPTAPAVSAITREGVVSEIQKLNRLTTSAYNIDTIITAQKDGTWYKLWQDEQKGLFVAKGRVLAGTDLSKLTAENVVVTFEPETNKNAPPKAHIAINLPASEIFEVYLDDIQVYDWKTGLFGMVDNDPEILKQAQTAGKTEVLKKACENNILQNATENAKEHVAGLFALTGAAVEVKMTAGERCQ